MSQSGWLMLDALDSAVDTSVHLVLIDHHDSFTQLIKHYLEQLGAVVSIVQSGDAVLEQVETLAPSGIILSPGPGTPEAAYPTQQFILNHYTQYPMLGICLGHQCLAAAFGGSVVQASEIFHGKTSEIHHRAKGLLRGLPTPFLATRYHSLLVSPMHLPCDWEVTAWTYDTKGQSIIMGMQHRQYPLFGVQYHPEAILTHNGCSIFERFIQLLI